MPALNIENLLDLFSILETVKAILSLDCLPLPTFDVKIRHQIAELACVLCQMPLAADLVQTFQAMM